jgi:hypothetical protein
MEEMQLPGRPLILFVCLMLFKPLYSFGDVENRGRKPEAELSYSSKSWPNNALQLTASSLRFAAASGSS